MKKTPLSIVEALLSDPANPKVVYDLVHPDATYINLNYENLELKRILPWAGTTKGPDAFIDTFHQFFTYWQALNFEIKKMFAVEDDVAVFGALTYRSNLLAKEVTSPFSIWAQVRDNKIVFFQYMEDSYAIAASAKVGGAWRIHIDPEGKPFEV
jgi:hypothetical protein